MDKHELAEKEKNIKEQYNGKNIYQVFEERKNINKITIDNNLMVVKKENFLKKLFNKILSIFKK